MQTDIVMDVTRSALKTALLLSAPPLLLGLVVGVITNVLQAVTQLNETTLSVVPKLIAMVVTLAVLGPWMLDTLVDFTSGIFEQIPAMIR